MILQNAWLVSNNHNLVLVKFEKHISEEAGNMGEALPGKLLPVTIRGRETENPNSDIVIFVANKLYT